MRKQSHATTLCRVPVGPGAGVAFVEQEEDNGRHCIGLIPQHLHKIVFDLVLLFQIKS